MVQVNNISDQVTPPASKGTQGADWQDHVQAVYAPRNTEITKLNGSREQFLTPMDCEPWEVCRGGYKEDEYAIEHLSPEEYAKYNTEVWKIVLNEINPFTGKTNQDDYPEHKKVLGMMDADQNQRTQELNDRRLNKDRDVAGSMYDPKTMQQFDLESKLIADWEKQRPGVKVDVSEFPLHKRVEEVIAKSQDSFSEPSRVPKGIYLR
jgi:hypothetical protein